MANASWRGKFHLARDPAHTIAHIGNDDNMVLKAIYPYRRLNRNVSFGSFVSWNGISQPPLHDGPPYKSNFGSRPGSAGGSPIGVNSGVGVPLNNVTDHQSGDPISDYISSTKNSSPPRMSASRFTPLERMPASLRLLPRRREGLYKTRLM